MGGKRLLSPVERFRLDNPEIVTRMFRQQVVDPGVRTRSMRFHEQD